MELTNSALQNMVSVFVFGPYKFLLLIGWLVLIVLHWCDKHLWEQFS
jgi:hypothetical protein